MSTLPSEVIRIHSKPAVSNIIFEEVSTANFPFSVEPLPNLKIAVPEDGYNLNSPTFFVNEVIVTVLPSSCITLFPIVLVPVNLGIYPEVPVPVTGLVKAFCFPLNVFQSVELRYPLELVVACVIPIVPVEVIVPPVIGLVVAIDVTVPTLHDLLALKSSAVPLIVNVRDVGTYDPRSDVRAIVPVVAGIVMIVPVPATADGIN